jgi:hypothetical protein
MLTRCYPAKQHNSANERMDAVYLINSRKSLLYSDRISPQTMVTARRPAEYQDIENPAYQD